MLRAAQARPGGRAGGAAERARGHDGRVGDERLHAARRRARRVRHHRRSGPQDDPALALPARAARAARLPGDRRRRRGLDRRASARARAGGGQGDRRADRRLGLEAVRHSGCHYVSGDFSRSRRPTRRSPRPSGTRAIPSSTWRSRPRCSRRSSPAWPGPTSSRAAAGSSSRSRSATTSTRPAHWRATCTSTWMSPSCTGSTTSWARWGWRRSSTCGSPTRSSSRCGTATTSRRCRSRWPRASASRTAATSTTRSAPLRDVVVNHLMQMLAAAAMDPPAAGDPDSQKDAKYAVFAAMADAEPGALRPRPVRRATGTSTASPATPTPRPTSRCGWRSTAGAGPGCRSSSAPASGCRSARPSCGSSSAMPRACRSSPRRAGAPGAEPDRVPDRPGDRDPDHARCPARRQPGPSEIELDMEFAKEGGEGATPYEVLLHAALVGDASHFTRQDSVEQTWRDGPAAARRAAEGDPLRPGLLGTGGGRAAGGGLRRLARPVAAGRSAGKAAGAWHPPIGATVRPHR